MQPACSLGEVTALELCPTYPFWLEAETTYRIFYRHAETSDSLSSMCRCSEQRQQAGEQMIPGWGSEYAAGMWALLHVSKALFPGRDRISPVTDKYYHQVISCRHGLGASCLCHAY